MGERKKIKLSEPFDWHGQKISEIELKEPTGWQAATIGEPRVTVFNAAIGGYFVEREDVIGKYLDACVVHESGADITKLVGLTDMLKIKSALFDFFTEAETRIAAEKLVSSVSAPIKSHLEKSAS